MKTIQLKPSCKDYLWGGEKLRTEYGIQSEMHPLSEAWMLSCHPDGPSYLPDGTTLQQYIDAHPGCLGTDCVKFEEFPILAKLIDAKKDLSIQVHPSNAYALEHEHQYGKTEMWYVLDCEPGTKIVIGHNAKDKKELEEMIRQGRWDEFIRVTVHTMMAACTYYAGGFIWGAEDNRDYMPELIRLKEMIINYATASV